jgi:hypothetical protein
MSTRRLSRQFRRSLLHKGSQMDPLHTTNLIILRSDSRMVRNYGIRDKYSRIAGRVSGVREDIGATATTRGLYNQIASHKEAVLLILIPKPSDAPAIW